MPFPGNWISRPAWPTVGYGVWGKISWLRSGARVAAVAPLGTVEPGRYPTTIPPECSMRRHMQYHVVCRICTIELFFQMPRFRDDRPVP